MKFFNTSDTIPISDNVINMMVMPFIMTAISSITALSSELIKHFISILSLYIVKLWKKLKYHIPYFRKYTIHITYNKEEDRPNENNQLLINAILYNFNNADSYNISNIETNKGNYTEIIREKNRSMVLSVHDEFTEDNITIIYNKTRHSSKKKEEEESSQYYIENLSLHSYISINHIKKYIEKKREKYITHFCTNDDKLYIFTGTLYGNHNVEFQRTIFDSHKNFNTWFSSKKEKVLELINNFKNKEGIFKLSTNVYKLGILLHGKGGVGKTSFIKALARELNRNIITISLNNFSNCASFMKLFASEYIQAPPIQGNQSEWIHIPMHKRLLVFEEIDTAGDIVIDRKKIREEIEKDKKLDIKKTKSELVLGDILTVLDGICELTGLVYIMTTNHIDMLDPALIRPGRITCAIELKEMNKHEMTEMLKYYYIENNIYNEQLSNHEKLQLIDHISIYLDGKCTPSLIENYCNQYNLINFHLKMNTF